MSDIFRYLRSGRVHPALVLVAPPGPARLRLVKQMAQLLLCREPAAPCRACSTCRRIERDVHPDVIFLVEEGEDTIKIDSIREICHQMEISPLEGGAKIGIIDDCHRMNTASSNAFLKTLEEPGGNRYFWLLTSQPRALVTTILSRCLQFPLKVEESLEDPLEGQYDEWLKSLAKSKNPGDIVGELSEKSDCLKFVRYLQRRARNEAVGSPARPYQALERFDKAVELEGRLRSNANYGLLLEVHLRQYFL